MIYPDKENINQFIRQMYGGGRNGYGGRLIGIVDSKTQLGAYEEIICKMPLTGKSTKNTETFVENKNEPVQFKESQETFEEPKSKGDFPASEFKKYKKIDREFKK